MDSIGSSAAHERGAAGAVAPGRPATDRIEWLVAATAALVLLAAAGWLRTLAVPYLVACVGATVGIAIHAARRVGGGARSRSRIALAVVAFAFCTSAIAGQVALHRVDAQWRTLEQTAVTRGQARLVRTLEASSTMLRAAARRTLDAPMDADSAFAFVSRVRSDAGWSTDADWTLVLYRDGRPVAWSGTPRGSVTLPVSPIAIDASAFYLELRVREARANTVAVATVVVHAEPPADNLTTALDEPIVEEAGLRRFEFLPADSTGGGRFAPDGVPLLTVRAIPAEQGAVRLAVAERHRVRGGLIGAVLLAAFLAALWPRPASLARRLGSVVVALVAVAVTPLSAYSNTLPLFDPLYYFAALGGPFTANAGALGLTSALVLLALFALLRWRVRVRSRALPALMVLVIAAFGPFLLRDLARGITPPRYGVTPGLWLSWEITIFLAACAVLLAGASAGQAALGRHRGLHPVVAPALAGLAAILAQPLLDATGRLPGWYAALWIAAMGALALSRRTRAQLLTAATVAGLGASTLVWGGMARKRVDLARRDVAGLGAPDSYARALLERLMADLDDADGTTPMTRADLLKRFTQSELAAAGYPVLLEARDDSGRIVAQLATSPGVGLGARDALDSAAIFARDSGEAIIEERTGAPTAQLVAALPHAHGVTTIAVASRTRLLADDPFAALYGLATPQPAEAPYRLAVSQDAREGESDVQGRWRREEDALHGNWTLPMAGGRVRAHAEVPLKSLDALVQRGVLVVLLDLAIVGLLWTGSALADGGLPRWMRVRRIGTARSYRTRLSFALFAFFVIPAAAFAVWSYRRLQDDNLQARVLVLGEALRGLAPADVAQPAQASLREQRPLFVFADGTLRESTDTLLAELAPLGRLTPARVQRTIVLGDELVATREEPLGPAGTLVGYRAVPIGTGSPAVVAAPESASEDTLERRRRDLGVLVLFATVLGALAALGLSGIAASELARPIGVLREAALTIASGQGQAIPAGDPPSEFAPVFSAFRQMSSDLTQSRSALEEAQRRTAAVLRNVASGVVAVDADMCVSLANPRAEALLGAPLRSGESLASAGAREIESLCERFVRSGSDEEEFEADHRGRQLRGRLTRLSRGGAVLTLDDVTELAHAQRVLAWGEMARQVAHEIKNPLTPIRLGVQMLRRAHADKRADFDRILDQNVGRILAEIDRLDEIARAFSRYGTAPQEQPRAEPVDVAMILRDVVALERMGEGSVNWHLEGTDAPIGAMAREDELREVLLNLLENARLAGARTITSRLAASNGRVRIAVSDDGAGIAPEVLPRIFEPHFSTRTSGSGLGLAISRRMIEGWSGTITATSVPGRGTTMTVELVAVGGDAE